MNTMFARGVTVNLAQGIIDNTCLVLYNLHETMSVITNNASVRQNRMDASGKTENYESCR